MHFEKGLRKRFDDILTAKVDTRLKLLAKEIGVENAWRTFLHQAYFRITVPAKIAARQRQKVVRVASFRERKVS